MSSSPKRRRTSITSYVDVENEIEQRPKAIQKRASYQSPTKASLARTNPEVLKELAQAKERRESEPYRRQSLRDAVLNRNPPKEADVSMPDLETEPAPDNNVDSTPASQVRQPRGLDLSEVFKDIPQPVEAKPAEQQSPIPPSSISLITRTSAQIRSPSIVPKLVQSIQPRRESRSPSTELPPTPVNGSPARPRGLASSSPGGRYRRSRMNHVTTTSPLKPKDPPPVFVEEEDDLPIAEVASGIGDDFDRAVEVNPLDELLQMELNDENLQEKQTKLSNLVEMVRTLQDECTDLSMLSSKIFGQFPMPQFPAEDFERQVDDIVEAVLPSNEEAWRQPEAHPTFQQNHETYLALCKSDNLNMTYHVDLESTNLHNTTYKVKISACEPFPAEIVDIDLTIKVDPVTKTIKAHHFLSEGRTFTPEVIRNWIAPSSPALELDLLMTVLSNHFLAEVQRATTMHNIDHPEDEIDLTKLSQATAARLIAYLGEPGHIVEIRNRGKSLMLTYHVSGDWNGHSIIKTNIVTEGCSANTRDHVRKLYKETRSVDGIPKAFQAVRTVLMDEGPAMVTKKSRERPKKKARRMIEFAGTIST